MLAEALVAEEAVKRSGIGVQGWLARLDQAQGHAAAVGRRYQRVATDFLAAAGADEPPQSARESYALRTLVTPKPAIARSEPIAVASWVVASAIARQLMGGALVVLNKKFLNIPDWPQSVIPAAELAN